jgi:CheB methylesterase
VTHVMDRCNVIVVGASAGGVILLMELVAGLPGDLNAAVAVALHVPEESPGSRVRRERLRLRQGPCLAWCAGAGSIGPHDAAPISQVRKATLCDQIVHASLTRSSSI